MEWSHWYTLVYRIRGVKGNTGIRKNFVRKGGINLIEYLVDRIDWHFLEIWFYL